MLRTSMLYMLLGAAYLLMFIFLFRSLLKDKSR
jgi:hypothetical protein